MSEAQLWPDEFKLEPAADPVHVKTDFVVIVVHPRSYTGDIYHQQSLPWTPSGSLAPEGTWWAYRRH